MNKSIQPLIKKFHSAVERSYNKRGKPGKIGKLETDNTYSIGVEDRPGWVYVTPDDGGTIAECMPVGITPIAGMPVRIVRGHDGYEEAIADGLRSYHYLGDGAGHTGFVVPHTHELGGGLDDYVSPRRVLHGSVRATVPASMSVIIDAFDYRYAGSDYHVERTTFDLSGYTPPTAANWQWVKVGYDPATQAFVAVEGAEQSVLTPLNEDALPAISMAGYIPLGAVRIREDDTSFPEVDANRVARFADIRQFLGASDVLGPSSTDDVPEGAVNLYFTNERAQDAIGAALVDSATIDFTYSDAGNTITATVIQAGIDHGSISGLGDDDHTIYALLGGRAGGQTLYGGNAASNNLVLNSTAHATKGSVLLANSLLRLDEANGIAGLGGAAISGAKLAILAATTSHKALILKTTDDNSTNPLLEAHDSSGVAGFVINADGTVAVTKLYLKQDGSKTGGQTTWLQERPNASVKRVMLYVEPDGFNTAGFIAAPTGTTAKDVYFNLWGADIDAGFDAQGFAGFGFQGASQSYDLRIFSGTGGALSGFRGDIVLTPKGSTTGDLVRLSTDSGSNYSVRLLIPSSTRKGIVIVAAASQSANLQEWQDSGSGVLLSVAAGGHLTFGEAINIIVGTSTGTKIGTSTSQKLGFWNATPIVQPAHADQAALTDSTGGTADGTMSAVSGSGDDTNINNNFKELTVKYNRLRADLVSAGIIKGSA